MPARRTARPEQAWEAALARFAEGETIEQIGADEAMPSPVQWRHRKRQDPEFSARADAALRRRRSALHKTRFGQEVWDALLATIATGETLEAACARPGMPTAATLHARCGWDQKLRAALDAALVAARAHRPSRTKFTRADLEAVIAAVAAGTPLSRACRAAGAPAEVHFRKCCARDPALQAELEAAQRQARRAPSEAAWDELLLRIAEGARLADLAGVDGRPTLGQWARRRKRDPAFAARADAALQAQGGSRAPISDARWSKIADRLAVSRPTVPELQADPSLPHYLTLLRRLKRSDAVGVRLSSAWSAPRVHPRLISTSRVDEALAAVAAGHRLSRIGELGLMSYGAISDRRRKDPEFAARLLALRPARPRPIAPLKTPSRVDDMLRTALSGNDVWRAVNAAVARGLPDFIRDDVVGEMVADVFEGHLALADVRSAARGYVSAYHRASGTWTDQSFDAALSGQGSRSLHELLSRD